jgi:hypothetical protein
VCLQFQINPISKCRCDERLKTKDEETRNPRVCQTLGCSVRELEHLKIKTRLIDEKFPSVMGESVKQSYCLL